MYATTSYVGIKRDGLNYLFFLLTEKYIQESKPISEALPPLLNEFAKNLGEAGALVVPFEGQESKTFEEVINKAWTDAGRDKLLSGQTPALLILDRDFLTFDPNRDAYIVVSLRD